MPNTEAVNRRVASFQLEKLASRQALNITVPRDITDKDFARLGKSIIDIIHSQTGCTCLSGVIHVVLQEEFASAINVDLNIRG